LWERLRRAHSGPGGGGCLEGNEMETFSLGDTIRVELDLRDESGVSTVSAAFYELNSGKGFICQMMTSSTINSTKLILSSESRGP
jgi:hypothetical protein